MSAARRAGPWLLGALVSLGAAGMGIDWATKALAGIEAHAASPGVRALSLAWERTHCFDCEALAEPGASEARARARPRR